MSEMLLLAGVATAFMVLVVVFFIGLAVWRYIGDVAFATYSLTVVAAAYIFSLLYIQNPFPGV